MKKELKELFDEELDGLKCLVKEMLEKRKQYAFNTIKVFKNDGTIWETFKCYKDYESWFEYYINFTIIKPIQVSVNGYFLENWSDIDHYLEVQEYKGEIIYAHDLKDLK